MIMEHLPNEAYQLAAEYGLGEPIKMYKTDKRSAFKTIGCALLGITLFCLFMVLVTSHFQFSGSYLVADAILAGILIFVALLFLLPLALMRPSTVYICADGFIWHRKASYRAVRWEEVEWVLVNRESCTVYLKNKQKVIISQFVGQLEELGQEIELKARLANRPDANGSLERQFEQAVVSLEARWQEEKAFSQGMRQAPMQETAEEAFKLREEFQLGDGLGTYHAGPKGVWSNKIIKGIITYALALLWIFVLVSACLGHIWSQAPSIVSFFSIHSLLSYIILMIILPLFNSFFFVRHVRLHLYTEGFIYIAGSSRTVVRWEQIEKLIYSHTMPIWSPPFCRIYLADNLKLEINGYMQQQKAIKQVFNEHVKNIVQAGWG